MHLLWYQYFQLFSLLCAIFCRRGLNYYGLAIMIPLLVLDNLTEIVAGNFRLFHWQSNYTIYNLYLLLSTPFFLYLFSILLNLRPRHRAGYLIFAILLEILILLNFFFYQGPVEFNTYSNLVLQATNIVLSSLTLASLTVGRDDESAILQDPRFTIGAMILLFSMVTLIILGTQKYIREHNIELRHKILYLEVMPIANAVLYMGYSLAFVLCRMQTANKTTI
ncbi:MAG: hypothetical protein JST68_27275 [Bacteroidetes bacterium]|nr:hypothetical protein [Bacteroidota bacterium]